MDRRNSMARFDERLHDPEPIAHCAYCREELCVGDDVIKFVDGEVTHKGHCFEEYAVINFADAYGELNYRGEID